MRGRLVVVSGPSGVGKGTVIAELRRRRPDVWLSVSTTTRPPRPGEVDGVNYHFVGVDEFQQRAAEGGFIEWARYAGNLYGTAREPVEARLSAGGSVLLEIEIDGARQVKQAFPDAILVFLAPPSEEELARRLRGRGTETPEVAAARLSRAREEMAAVTEFDRVITNSDVPGAVDELLQLWDGHDRQDPRASDNW